MNADTVWMSRLDCDQSDVVAYKQGVCCVFCLIEDEVFIVRLLRNLLYTM